MVVGRLGPGTGLGSSGKDVGLSPRNYLRDTVVPPATHKKRRCGRSRAFGYRTAANQANKNAEEASKEPEGRFWTSCLQPGLWALFGCSFDTNGTGVLFFFFLYRCILVLYT